MSLIRTALRSDTEIQELLCSTSRNLISIVAALYLAWHFIATLVWSQIFSPRLWLTTFLMIVIVVASLRLVERHYLAAQAIWLGGLAAAILQAYTVYQRPEILVLLVFLPLMAMVTAGANGTLLVELMIIGLLLWLARLPWLPELPPGYAVGIVIGSIFSAFFGWGLSSNLLSAIDAASYHYQEARNLLEETRQHRAEISRMLKDRNQANYQLERLNQMLHFARVRAEEARADRDRFVLAVSHELRSPLNFILGFSDLMVNSPETYASPLEWPPSLYEDVQEIYRSSKHLLGLINDILDMGQIDAHQMALFREQVKIENLVVDVKGMVGGAFAQKGLWLETDFEADLPEVFVDATRIRQVLLNLVNNSLRFTERGGVTVSAQREDGIVRVVVADTGAGIAPEDVAKVFEEFRQVGLDPWRRREGSGLGLSISRRFVELHGGKMWLESTPGEGTCFYFTLPTLEAGIDLDGEVMPEAVGGSWAGSVIGQREKVVLLLSEDALSEKLVQQWLEGYRLVPVEQPDLLLARVAQYLPQAILVDKMFTNEARLMIKDLPYDLPVIAVLFPERQGRYQDLPPGISRYLVKPVSRQLLLETIAELDGNLHRLLLVDDDPAMVRFVSQALKSGDTQAGLADSLQMLTAFSGKEALEQLTLYDVDVLLLDLDLPDMNGWEVLERMRQAGLRRNPQVVIISALELPRMLFANGLVNLELIMKRPLSSQEVTGVLKPLLDSIQPSVPKAEYLAVPGLLKDSSE